MKKVLLGTSALLGVGLLAGTAQASDGVKLSLGGFIRNQMGVVFDDDSNGEGGDNKNDVGVGTDAEIYFLGSVTLDNGITVGARFELEGGDENNDQFDQAYAYFKGGFGDIRIGAQADAAANLYMLPPGSSNNFGPYSPNSIGTSLASPAYFDPVGSTANQDKSQKISYYSPTWGGFSFGVSYTPNDNNKDYNNGDDADQQWRADSDSGDAENNISLGLHYDYEGDGWGLALGGAAYWEGDIQQKGANNDEQSAYNAGINVNFGGLTVGVAGTYLVNTSFGNGNDFANSDGEDTWVIGTGLSYNVDAWTVGAGWAHLESEVEGFGDESVENRVGVTGAYEMGPGITLDAGLFYTWLDTADDTSANDNYDSLEFAVGSSISF
ncbi:porin [Dongia sp.]|uniref:porin n=1 Tax=Dongia sp. TaxID=1977262 RepID=UPI0035B49BA4